MPGKIEITADDWGFSPGVNQGILELARLGVVRRVSILAISDFVKDRLEELCTVPGLGFGLHFNLTQTQDHSSLGSFARWWMFSREARGSKAARVQDELVSQLDALRGLGIQPTSLEGHHHVQILPGMIRALAPALRKSGIARIRIPKDFGLLLGGKFPIPLLSIGAEMELMQEGFSPPPPCVYPKNADFLDVTRLRACIRNHEGHEMITHPAAFDDLKEIGCMDSYRGGRVIEYRALRQVSDAFGVPFAPSST